MTEILHITSTHDTHELITVELVADKQYCVQLDDNVHAKLMVRYAGDLHDNNIEVELANNASLKMFHVQNAQHDAKINTAISVKQASTSSCEIFDSALGGSHVNIDYHIELNGKGAHCEMTGVFITDQQQKICNKITMLHNAEHTTSNQNYKGIAQDQSTASFFTKVIVAKDAQKVSSTQSNKNLLLSDKATIDSKPELEIYADDVQCAHGATVGELDQDALFYLQSRGIALQRAQAMLTYAFVQQNIQHEFDDLIKHEVLAKIPNYELLGVQL